MKKVLFVVDERKMGGVSTVLESYLNNMNLNNKKVDVLVLHDNGDKLSNIPDNVELKFIGNELDVIDIPLKSMFKSFNIINIIKKLHIIFSIKTGTIKNIIQNIREKYNIKDYDIEIAFKDGFCQIFTAYGNSRKKISWLHNDYSLNNFIYRYRKLFKKILTKFDKIVAISDDIRNNFCKLYNNQEKMVVINNYVDEDRILKMSNERINISIDKSKLNLLCIGRLSEEKGYNRLIDAIDLLKSNNKGLNNELNIDIIGNGPQDKELIEKVNRYGLNNIIKFLGRKDNPYSYINYYDMVLIPSKYEAYCVVMIEALINKTPIITTKVASVNQITENGKYGMIVENSTEGIYTGIESLLRDRGRIDKYRQNLKDYSYKKNNRKIINMFNEILEESENNEKDKRDNKSYKNQN